MERIILSHNSALVCTRELRINLKNSSMLNLARSLMLSKKRYGNSSVHIMVNSQNKKCKN